MTFLIKDGEYKKFNKIFFENLFFFVNNKESLCIFFKNKKYYKIFLNIFLGKKKLTKGIIFLNNDNITSFINKDRLIYNIYNSYNFLFNLFFLNKFILVFNLLKSPSFLYNSILNNINNKFLYKKFIIDNNYNNNIIKEIFHNIENLIKNYINNFIKFKKNSIKEYYKNIVYFYDKKLKKILINNFFNYSQNSDIFQNIRVFILKKEKIRIKEDYLSFLQSLYDKLNYIFDLNYICDCKYLSKKKKINIYFFKNKEINLIYKKYLNFLKIKILYQRYKIFILKKNNKKYYFNIFNLIFNNKKIKKQKKIKKIIKKNINFLYFSSKKEWDIYDEKQENLLITVLMDEAIIVKEKIIEELHNNYHFWLFSNNKNKILNKNKNFNKNIYNEKNKLKNNIINIYNQAFKSVEELINILKIKISLFKFKFTKNLSNFDKIKLKLVNSILLKKKLIIFYNIFDNLTYKESIELFNIIENIKNYDNDIKFIFFTKKIDCVKENSDKFLIFDKIGNFNFLNYKDITFFPKNLNLYKIINNKLKNIFLIKYDLNFNQIELNNLKIKLPKNIFLSKSGKYWLAINYKFVSFEKNINFNKKLNLIFKGKIKYFNFINKKTFIIFKTYYKDFDIKLLLNNNDFKKNNNEIFFENNSLLIYDFFNKNLIKII